MARSSTHNGSAVNARRTQLGRMFDRPRTKRVASRKTAPIEIRQCTPNHKARTSQHPRIGHHGMLRASRHCILLASSPREAHVVEAERERELAVGRRVVEQRRRSGAPAPAERRLL
eukprot:2920643-Pleurochrysis_carterae.AAC.1